MRIQRLDANTRQNLLEDLLKRSPNNYGEYEKGVAEILARVKREKDEAVFEYTRKFDQAVISAANIKVTEDEIKEAYELADPALVEIIRKALKNIEAYHEKQRQYSWFDSKPDGTMLGQKVTPLKRVGVYVPGGKAVYPSSVLMNIMPAKVAGVEEIIMVTPPDKDGKVTPNTLVAAHEQALLPSISGRSPGNRRAGVWNPEHSEGGQDRWPGQYLCGSGEKSSLWPRKH